MIQFDKNTIGRQAKELGFVRDTFEKVCRLADVLKFFEKDDIKIIIELENNTGLNDMLISKKVIIVHTDTHINSAVLQI